MTCCSEEDKISLKRSVQIQSYTVGGFQMSVKKVTLNINPSVYKRFKKYCKERGLIVSKIVEIFMKKELRKNDKRQ